MNHATITRQEIKSLLKKHNIQDELNIPDIHLEFYDDPRLDSFIIKSEGPECIAREATIWQYIKGKVFTMASSSSVHHRTGKIYEYKSEKHSKIFPQINRIAAEIKEKASADINKKIDEYNELVAREINLEEHSKRIAALRKRELDSWDRDESSITWRMLRINCLKIKDTIILNRTMLIDIETAYFPKDTILIGDDLWFALDLKKVHSHTIELPTGEKVLFYPKLSEQIKGGEGKHFYARNYEEVRELLDRLGIPYASSIKKLKRKYEKRIDIFLQDVESFFE